MKIAILGDTHFGQKNDNPVLMDFQENYYKNIFFPYIDKNNIDTIIQVGDLFDRRKYINFNTLKRSFEFFFNEITKRDLKLYITLGNHCIYYKNILDVNSPSLLLKNIPNIHIIDKPQTIKFDKTYIDMYPWICEQNMDKTLNLIENTKSKIAIGHFEISGFEMDKGHVCIDGMDRKTLKKYDMVISGHFHHRSNDGHIYYVGTPYEMSWACYNDPKGFHIFDTMTNDLTFVKNTNILYYKFYYDDSNETKIKDIKSKIIDGYFNEYKNKFVKIAVVKKTNIKLYDSLLHELYNNIGVEDLTIVEDHSNPISYLENTKLDQMDDTLTSINKHIEELETPVDINKETLKKYVFDIHQEATLHKHSNDV